MDYQRNQRKAGQQHEGYWIYNHHQRKALSSFWAYKDNTTPPIILLQRLERAKHDIKMQFESSRVSTKHPRGESPESDLDQFGWKESLLTHLASLISSDFTSDLLGDATVSRRSGIDAFMDMAFKADGDTSAKHSDCHNSSNPSMTDTEPLGTTEYTHGKESCSESDDSDNRTSHRRRAPNGQRMPTFQKQESSGSDSSQSPSPYPRTTRRRTRPVVMEPPSNSDIEYFIRFAAERRKGEI